MIIAADIGGSKILAGIFKESKLKRKIKLEYNKQQPLKDILTKALDSLYDSNIKAIKVACPGPGDFSKGILYSPENINARNFNIKEFLKKTYKTKIIVNNDANCFALYQSHKLKISNLVGITLGTGIGFGAIINNKVYLGRGLASELSHIILGNQELEKEYKNILKNSKYSSFKEAYESKKSDKRIIFDKLSEIVAITIYDTILAYDPEAIVLGGGVTKAKTLFWEQAKDRLSELLKRYGIKKPVLKIDSSELATLKGASLL